MPFLRTCFGAILALLILAQPVLAFDLTVLHVNDSHSYLDATGDKLKPEGKSTYVKLGAWARLQTAVDGVRSEKGNVALLHAGDAVQGDLYFMKYNGKPEMEFLNRLGFDAYTLGNHEFDKGTPFLVKFLKYAKLPVLGANIDASGQPKLAEKLKPYTILTYGKEKVGIIGLTIKDTAFISSPGKGVTFVEEAEAAKKYVKELQAKGVDKIILLTHVGLDNDKKLAATVPGVDVIVGGHSHSLLADPDAMSALGKKVQDTYPVIVKGADGNDVYVVTAWKWGRVLGRLDVTFDANGQVTAAKGLPVMLVGDSFRQKNEKKQKVALEGEAKAAMIKTINSSPVAEVVAKDAKSVAFLKPYSAGVEEMRKDIIGIAVRPLPHIRVPGVNDSGVDLKNGSLIAPIVCKAMLAKLATTGEPADIALQNAGGVRESVEQGNITVGTAYTLMPFNNSLTLLTLTGAQVKTALETGVTRGSGAFPYVGGARYTADMNKPEGQRITKVEVFKKGKWMPLNTSDEYRLVTNSYLAGGGDGYVVMKEAKTKYDTGFVDAEAFIEYVKKTQYIKAPKVFDVTYIPAK